MKHSEDSGIRIYPKIQINQAGRGLSSGGQSGDTQGLSDVAEATSESVMELVEEGQFFEAEVVSGIEEAADHEEVQSSEVLEVANRPPHRKSSK